MQEAKEMDKVAADMEKAGALELNKTSTSLMDMDVAPDGEAL